MGQVTLKAVDQRMVTTFLNSHSRSVTTVYGAVPMGDTASVRGVLAALHNAGSKGCGLNQVAGTLKLLAKAGLIKEVQSGEFSKHPTTMKQPRQQEQKQPEQQPEQQPDSEKQTMTSTTSNDITPILNNMAQVAVDICGIAQKLRECGHQLQNQVETLREEIETLPTITPEITTKLAKLDQFAQLMKGMI